MWRRENVTIGLSVKTVDKTIISNAEREEARLRASRTSAESTAENDTTNVAHLPKADDGLEDYRQPPREAKREFLDHLAELIAEEVMRGRGKDS